MQQLRGERGEINRELKVDDYRDVKQRKALNDLTNKTFQQPKIQKKMGISQEISEFGVVSDFLEERRAEYGVSSFDSLIKGVEINQVIRKGQQL